MQVGFQMQPRGSPLRKKTVTAEQPLCTFFKTFCTGTLLLAASSLAGASEHVLLDFNVKFPPPKGWAVEGYTFGTRNPVRNERRKHGAATHSQRDVKQGRMTSPGFTIKSDYLKINCAGTYHPTEMAIVLRVVDKEVRS